MNEPSRLDENTYDSSRIYLKATLEHMLEAGRSVRELSEFALEKFGTDFLPYLRQFLYDVGHGRISVKGLTRSAQTALSGHAVSSEERDCMIREAAYLRAERRGFCGGSAEQDWLEAEREVDLRLAQGGGLVVKGGRALATVAAAVEQELASSKQVVTRWLGRKFPARAAAGRKKPVARKARAGSRSAVGAPRASAEAKKKPAQKKVIKEDSTGQKPVSKTAVRKKTTKGQAARKTAVKERPAKKAAAKKTAVKERPAKKAAAKKTAARKKTSPGRGESPVTGGTSTGRKKVATKKKSTPTSRNKTTTKKQAAGGKSTRKQGRSGAR